MIHNKAVQGNHWVNDQISIFTAVSNQGDSTQSFAVISDDRKHDSAYALLAVKTIINYLKANCCDSIKKITIVSDGAACHFKNRFQLYELKRAPFDIKWLFSATGHGKGAVDGVGRLIKHYATSHNLREPHEKSIQNANDFVEHVQKYTDAIKIIHLQDVEVEEFRKIKNVDWLATPKYPGIQKTHLWIKETCNDEVHCLTAKTADRPLTEVRIMKQKNKGSHKNKKSKRQK